MFLLCQSDQQTLQHAANSTGTGQGSEDRPCLKVTGLGLNVPGSKLHDFHVIGDGHQPNSRGLYTHYKDSVIKGGRSPIPNTRSLDPGTNGHD